MAGASDLNAAFKLFASKGNGSEATTKDMTRWCTDAKVFGKKFSSNDMDIIFSAIKVKGKTTITTKELGAFIDKAAKSYAVDKKMDEAAAKDDLVQKLASTTPKAHGTTGTSKTGNVSGMTDASKYTGAHKERFDESGKGKGKEGRTDTADNSGYVGNYKGAGTYDKKK